MIPSCTVWIIRDTFPEESARPLPPEKVHKFHFIMRRIKAFDLRFFAFDYFSKILSTE